MPARTRPVLFASLFALATFLSLGGVATAQDPREPTHLWFVVPQETELGNSPTLVAWLRDSQGRPIPDAVIQLATPALFAGAVGEMDIGTARTDAEGMVQWDYQLRVQGQNQFTVRFLGNQSYQPAEAAAHVVATGTAQLAQRTAGVDFPLPGELALLLVLLGVWSVYLMAMLLVFRIPEKTQVFYMPQGRVES